MSRSHSEIKIISFLPEHILPVAFNARPGRFLIEAEFPNQKYDVVMNTAGRKDLLESMMQQAVSAALGIEAVWENRMVDAYVLRKSPETKLEPLPAVQGSYSRASKRRTRGLQRRESCARGRIKAWIGPYSMRQDSIPDYSSRKHKMSKRARHVESDQRVTGYPQKTAETRPG